MRVLWPIGRPYNKGHYAVQGHQVTDFGTSRKLIDDLPIFNGRPMKYGRPLYFCPVVSSFFFLSSIFFFFFRRYSQPSQIGCLPYFHTWSGHGNLECRSETCCTRLAENTGRKKSPENSPSAHHPQLCRAISSQLRHVSTIVKELVKQRYLPHKCSQYGELRPTSG